MKNKTQVNNSPVPRSTLSITKSKSMADIINIPTHLHNSSHLRKQFSEADPIVTVTVKSKTGNRDQHVIKKPKDWKEVVEKSGSNLTISKSKSSSSVVTPLKVPKPTFQYLSDNKDCSPQQPVSAASENKLFVKNMNNSVPTLHIPAHTSESRDQSPGAAPVMSRGHPGLPCGLQRMTSSLMHHNKSPTKMTLKEMKRIPSKVLDQPMSIITPAMLPSNTSSENSDSSDSSDQPPQLSPQISLSRSRDRSSSPGLSRSRLQLKPATSPKLNIEQYLTVSTDTSKLLLGKSDSPRTRRSGLLIENNLSDNNKSRTQSESPGQTQQAEKKSKRESLSKKSSVPVLIPWSKRNKEPPKKSGGWSWKGDSFIAKIYLNNEELPVERICYTCMRHEEGDEEVSVKDCILLASGSNRKKDLPFIAKVTALWENPDDGEMMMSLLWFYRPEHTEFGRQPGDCKDELFASKHRDFTSVACIEDKCFVMTFNEYCRYVRINTLICSISSSMTPRAENYFNCLALKTICFRYMRFSRMIDADVSPPWNIVPERKEGYPRAGLLPTCQVAHDRVFLCRKVYDPKGRKMYKNPY